MSHIWLPIPNYELHSSEQISVLQTSGHHVSLIDPKNVSCTESQTL